MTNFEKVGLFMKTFGQEVKTKAELSNSKINDLRISLINEELEELKEAVKNNDILDQAIVFFTGQTEMNENVDFCTSLKRDAHF